MPFSPVPGAGTTHWRLKSSRHQTVFPNYIYIQPYKYKLITLSPIFVSSPSFTGRKARALYACKAEHDSELSFIAGTIFENGESCLRSHTQEEKNMWAGVSITTYNHCWNRKPILGVCFIAFILLWKFWTLKYVAYWNAHWPGPKNITVKLRFTLEYYLNT